MLWLGYQLYVIHTCKGFLCTTGPFVMVTIPWVFLYDTLGFTISDEFIVSLSIVLNVALLLGLGSALDFLLRYTFHPQIVVLSAWFRRNRRLAIAAAVVIAVLIVLLSLSFLPRYNCHSSMLGWHCHTWWEPIHDH